MIYSRPDKHYTPIDPTLASNMRIARAQRKSAQSIKRKLKDDEDAIYSKSREIDEELKKTRITFFSENAQALKKSQAEHPRILERAYCTKKIKEVVDEAQSDKRKRH